MKKKAIKIAASTAVAASAFVAAAPAQQADAATNVNQLATDAQNAGTVLKWAISVEGSANYVTRPYDQYNAAKKAIAAAEAAAAKLSTSEKLSIDAKLVEPKLQVKRAQAYIDAITSSEKIQELTAGLDSAIKTDDIEKVEAAYHKATAEYRKQAALLDRVYGQSTRDGIRNEVKPAIEKLVASVKNEVTVNMLAKSASANAKAGKFEEAAKNLSDAQAILDANVLKWETALQKSVSDVEASIPLSVLSLTSNNKNTVTVKFSTKIEKGAATLPAGQFTFTNGLVVQSASVAADGKTVTLVTTEQKTNTEYALSYQGKATGKSFKTPADANDTTLVINETTALNLETSQERSYSVSITKVDGTAYTGQVKIELIDEDGNAVPALDASIISVNGVKNASNIVTANNGKVTFVIKGHTAGTVIPKVTRVEDDSYKTAGATNFWNKVTADANFTALAASDLVVDKTAKAIYVNTNKYSYDANDKFFIKNVEVTVDQFFAALSAGDTFTFDYKKDEVNISTFKIDNDITAITGLSLTTPAKAITHDQNAIRLEGKGENGYIVEVYKVTSSSDTVLSTDKYVASATVSNGTWVVNSLNLTADATNQFRVVMRAANQTATDVAASGKVVTVYQQQFATVANGLQAIDAGKLNEFGIGDTVVFTVPNAGLSNNNLKVTKGATITLKDGQGRTRTYVVEKVANTTNQVKVVDVVTSTVVDNYDTGFGNSLTAVTGITNQDNLTFKVSESKDVTLEKQ